MSRPKDDTYKHETGDWLLDRLCDLENEITRIHKVILAVVATGKIDPQSKHALEMLVPGTGPRKAELAKRLREKGMGHLADRMEYIEKHAE
jgi:hypothetical protein